jgi:hypothetical protein
MQNVSNDRREPLFQEATAAEDFPRSAAGTSTSASSGTVNEF